MKITKLAKGLIFLVLGLALIACILYFFLSRKGINIVEYISNIFPEKVEEIIDGKDDVIYLDSLITEDLGSSLSDWVEDEYLFVYFSDEVDDSSDFVISSKDQGNYDLAWKKYYVLITSPKNSLSDVTVTDLEGLLAGNTVDIDGVEYDLIISTDSLSYAKNEFTVGVSVPSIDDAVASVFENSSQIALVSFDEVYPKAKVLSIDDNNLFSEFDEESYPLVQEVWVKESSNIGLYEKVKEVLGEVNFESDAVTSVVVTGTSVMGARGLFQRSEELNDPIYPIRAVADIFKNADIAHVSNEAAFIDGCQQGGWSMVFCGTLESFEGFKFAGIDVIGLTGNHVLDYGDSKFLETLDLFEDNDMQYFGGGKNFSDAHTPAVEEVNGLTFAFLGYNNIPPVSSFATSTEPGSAQLDMNQMILDIEDASSKYDFVLIDMQWGNEYENTPLSYQVEYGRAAIDAGADVVTGVHPHWVQKLEYYGDGVIFYGVGNLLFDQMWSQRTREGLMVRHYFYNGEHVSFDLIPTMIYEGAQPRPVTGDDASRIVNYLF